MSDRRAPRSGLFTDGWRCHRLSVVGPPERASPSRRPEINQIGCVSHETNGMLGPPVQHRRDTHTRPARSSGGDRRCRPSNRAESASFRRSVRSPLPTQGYGAPTPAHGRRGGWPGAARRRHSGEWSMPDHRVGPRDRSSGGGLTRQPTLLLASLTAASPGARRPRRCTFSPTGRRRSPTRPSATGDRPHRPCGRRASSTALHDGLANPPEPRVARSVRRESGTHGQAAEPGRGDGYIPVGATRTWCLV